MGIMDWHNYEKYGNRKMDYPHGWSFWSRDEWKALKDRRTDHYAKLKVKAQGTLTTEAKQVKFSDRPVTAYQAAFKEPVQKVPQRPKTTPNRIRHSEMRDNDYYRKARSGFKYWYDEPLGMGTKKVPSWQKYTVGTYKTFYGLQTTPKTFLWGKKKKKKS